MPEEPTSTVVYGYSDTSWKDKLTSYNGEEITYDANGNPLSYRDGISLAWKNGRSLAELNNGAKNTKTTYTYNEDGIRIMKNFEGIKTRYLLDGTNIIAQEVTNGDSLDYIYFFYDAAGSPVGMNYLGYNYYYKKNLQGDIIEIWGTEDGTDNHTFRCLVKYVYDAWGNILQMNDTTDGWYRVGTANPFRYRGYYYDNESGFYYLQSRYYDPATGRFLNADDTDFLGETDTIEGYNLYSYCGNNGVSRIDPSGKVFVLAIGAGITISFGTFVAFVAIATFSLAYIFDSGFRKAVNSFFKDVFNGLVCGIGYLTNVMSEVMQRASRSWRNDVHHIVARTDARAARSRNILCKLGISINSKYNLVTINKGLHARLHTNSYHAAVTLILEYCKRRHPEAEKNAVIAGLVMIAIILKSASRYF